MKEMIISGVFGDAPRTGLRLGAASGKTSVQLLSRLMGNPGYIVRDDDRNDDKDSEKTGAGPGRWSFDISFEDAGSTVLAGPAFDGQSLDEAVFRAGPPGEKAMASVARALERLREKGFLPDDLLSCGILAGVDGVLVLPPKAVHHAFSRLATGKRQGAVAFFRSPKARDAESAAVFLLAQAAYRLACGCPAYTESGAAGNGASRDGAAGNGAAGNGAAGIPFIHGGFLQSLLAEPRLHPDIAGLIDASLTDPSSRKLSVWVKVLDSAAGRGWLGDVDPVKLAEAGRERGIREEKIRTENRRNAFWRKKGSLITAAAAAFAVLALVVGSVIVDKSNGPDFSKLEPAALVETYYKAVDALDGISMEAAASRAALKIDDTLVTNLTVLTKMRMAYERKSPLMSARDWIAAGKPVAETGTLIYGITGLMIAPDTGSPGKSATDELVRFRADYTLWTTRSADIAERMAKAAGEEKTGTTDTSGTTTSSDSMQPPLIEGRKITDILVLERAKKARKGIRGWKITAIERTEKDPAE
ncbi:MAG: hypothetical protein Q8O15_06320 [Rectinemataceae bacterium]|nr:hypothetical protein [Rectinemataceae bacterium]